MKNFATKTGFAIAALSFAVAALAHDAPATTSGLTAGASGIAGVSAAISGNSAAGLNGGSSQSGAQSLQSAQVATYSNTIVPGGNINGAQQATIGAVGSTASQGFAYNLSTGAASGNAAMSGTAYQAAAGAAATQQVGNPGSPATGWPFPQGSGPCVIGCSPAVAQSNPYIPAGSATGSESSVSHQAVIAGTNQGAAIASVSGGNFGSDVGFTTNNTPITVPTTGNTTTTVSGNGLQLTAGAIGGTYSQTSTTNGVYQDGNNINFGGTSNQIANPAHGSPVLVNSATGSFAGSAQINGAISNGTPVNVQSPL